MIVPDLDSPWDGHKEENVRLFTDLLDANKINSFATWHSVRDSLANDPRYLALSSDSRRKEVYSHWSAQKKLTAGESGLETNSKIAYIQALRKHAKLGLPYPLFKRQHRNDPEFSTIELPEIERATIYRQFMLYAKLNESEKATFVADNPLFSSI